MPDSSIPAENPRAKAAIAMAPAPKPMSYIEPHEEVIARKMIDDQFIEMTGKPFGLRVAGYYLAVKLHVRPEEIKSGVDANGKAYKIYLPDTARAGDKYSACAGLVCGMGSQAYKGTYADGSPRYPVGPWARVGDFICLPRQESFLVTYHGVAMAILPDDKVIGVIESPEDVVPIDQADLF